MTGLNRIKKIDKCGCPFEVGECGAESSAALKEMYDCFKGLAVSQGLPPADKTRRDRWVDGLLEFGRNFLAWKEDKVAGHSSIIADFDRGDAEYIIFVSEPFRNRGFGSALTEIAVEVSRSIGLKRLWLTVEAFNFRAIRLYRNSGFVFVDEAEREKTMVLRL